MARTRDALLVKLTDTEHAALRARAQAERLPMASILRARIELPRPELPAPGNSASPSRREISGPAISPSRDRALELLAAAAEDGSVQAAMALAREQRVGAAPSPSTSDTDRVRERLLALVK